MLRSIWLKRLTVAILIPSVSGCASFWRPYLTAETLDDDVQTRVLAVPTENDEQLAYAISINQAFAASNEQRNLYLGAVNNHHAGRSAASTALFALSAWMVYKGVVTDASSSRRNIALGTATGAATYAFGNWFSNPQQEAAYLQGYRGITCAMWQIRPFLIPAKDYTEFLANRNKLRKAVDTLDQRYETLRLLERQLREVTGRKELSRIQTDFRLAERARKRAYSTLDKVDRFTTRVESAGFTLRRRVELIAASVNEEVQRASPDLKAIDTLVGQFSNQVASNAQSLKPDPLDLKDDTEADQIPNDDEPGGEQPLAPSAQTSPGKSVGTDLDRKIAGLDSKIKTLEKKLGEATKISAKSTDQALKKIRSDLEALKKSKSPAPATAVEKQATAGQQLDESIRNKTIVLMRDGNFPAWRNALKDARVAVWATLDVVESELNRAVARRVGRNVAQCRDTTAPLLVVSPAEEQVTLGAKSEVKFTVRGGEGVPRAFLTGDKGKGEAEVKMTTTADNGLVTIILTTADKQVPEGPATLLVTDSAGKQSEEIRISFRQPATPPSTPKQPAKEEAAGTGDAKK